MLILARKKIVFVIVEGPSDDEALSILLERIFEKNNVFVHITHGDMTTERGSSSSKILSKIGNLVRKYASSNHFVNKHFQEIIHIVDTDGAYVSDSYVEEDLKLERVIYTPSSIRTANVAEICDRNYQKSSCLNKMSTTKVIWGLPYRVYYMSSNLEHVLYNYQNVEDSEKEKYAIAFAKKYKDDVEGFISYMSSSDFSVIGDYLQSWSFIKEDLRSLERHSNLGICFRPYIDSKKV